jgi:predicted Zn-dependent protease
MLGHMEKLTIVRVGNIMSFSSLQAIGRQILEAFRGIIVEFRISHHESPRLESIDAHLLTMVLHQIYGGHTLGITDADLKTWDADEFYNTIIGGKNPRNDVAVVSTRRLSPERIHSEGDYDLYLNRTLKVALHEVGHNLGLTDHATYRRGSAGEALCPMSKGEFNRFGLKGYVRAVVDGRGLRFCEECVRFLRLVQARRCAMARLEGDVQVPTGC